MHVLQIGASGYVGRHTLHALLQAGHEVTALTRPGAPAPAGDIQTITGDLADVAALRGLAADHDGVMYTAAAAPEVEGPALGALLAGLEGSGRPLTVLGGSLVYGDTGPETFDEQHSFSPPPFLAARAAIEQTVLDAGARGVRTAIVHASLVHGHGGGDIPRILLASAAQRGYAAYLGDGTNAWSTSHVDGLADLLARAFDGGAPASVYNASHQELMMRDLAEDVRAALGQDTAPRSVTAEDVPEWSFFAGPLGLSQRFSSAAATAELGWQPLGPPLAEDLADAAYTEAARAA